MAGSGYSDIITDANQVTSGCLRGVLTGKHFNKSLWCVKIVGEALERLMLDVFIEQRCESPSDSIVFENLIELIKDLTPEKLDKGLTDEKVSTYLTEFEVFRQEIRDGKLGKTAQFWMQFLICSENIFMLLYAVKTHSVPVYHSILSRMTCLFFRFGGMNYSRYLSWFDMFLLNIEHNHPGALDLIKKGAISVARSMIPGNRCQVDKTMEETFMKFSKSSCGAGGAGVFGLLQNFGAYQRWIKTKSERVKYYQATLEMCGFPTFDETNQEKHYEMSRCEIERSEAALQRTVRAIKGFLNPFTIADKDQLYVISSGSPASSDIASDVLNAEQKGWVERNKFINEQLKTQCVHGTSKNFFTNYGD